MSSRNLALPFLLAFLVAPIAAQGPTVFVVDEQNGPGTDFTTLQAAIDAAAEGDFLVMRDGCYFGSLVGKSLAIQGLNLHRADVTLSVSALQATQYVAVRGCALVGDMSNNAGAIFIEEADISSPFRGELRIDVCADLVLRSVFLRDWWCGGALRVLGSSVYGYDSLFQGNTAQGSSMGGPQCGSEPAFSLDSVSQLYLHGSDVKGGNEGTSWGKLYCAQPAIKTSGSPVELTGCTVQAGTAFTCTPPPAINGSARFKAGTARRIVSPSPVFEGQVTTVEYHGDPGDFVFLTISPVPRPSTYYPQLGAFHGERSMTKVVPIGAVPASGVLVQSLTTPSYGPSETIHSFYLQGFFVAPSGERQLSAPTQVHLLDPNY